MVVAVNQAVASKFDAIALEQLMSRRNADTLRGIVGVESEQIGDRMIRGDRRAGKTFHAMVVDAFGVDQFCQEHNIPVETNVAILIDRAAFELGFSETYKLKQLEEIVPENCLPSLMYATNRGEVLMWIRIKERSLALFDAFCSGTTKRLVEREEERYQGRQPSRQLVNAAKSTLNPAPNTPQTQDLLRFRNHLSVSLLREWRSFIAGVIDPYNADKLRRIDDFISKFQRTGYSLSDRSLSDVDGLTVEMATRLGEIQREMTNDVIVAKAALRDSIGCLLETYSQESETFCPPGLGLTIKGASRAAFEIVTAENLAVIATEQELVTAESNRTISPYEMSVLPDFALAGLVTQAALARSLNG